MDFNRKYARFIYDEQTAGNRIETTFLACKTVYPGSIPGVASNSQGF
jgi:hypothetical protein